MKKSIRTIIAMTLLLVMATISPMTDLSVREGANAPNTAGSGVTRAKAATKARAAETDAAATGGNQLYISEVKIGMGETADEANKELTAEGYIILTDDSGAPADLNKDAGTDSRYKDGPKSRVVYLGYKTTTDPNEAITDLAAMNMKGGYSVEDYKLLMNQHFETRIKPFIERFIATINEYRQNLKKPEDTLNFKRADYFRRMLNKLIDDDTGGHIGDLLAEETKYEMGDVKYNALSDSEKKKHADIVTILLQGNGKAVALMEVLLSKATDSSDSTWLDRFCDTDLETLEDEIRAEKPSLSTKSDVDAELDKKYDDIARQLLDKWEDMGELLEEPEDKLDKATDSIEEREDKTEELEERLDSLELSSPAMEVAETVVDTTTEAIDATADAMDLRSGVVAMYLDTVDYQDGTLLDFFRRSSGDFSGNGIRELYPIAASLTEGQKAGLEFLSIMDLISIALQDEESFKDTKIETSTEASVFEGVDREIYEPGGVAITTETKRQDSAKAEKKDANVGITSDLSIIFYASLGTSALLTVGAGIAYHVVKNLNLKSVATLNSQVSELTGQLKSARYFLDKYPEPTGLEKLMGSTQITQHDMWSKEVNNLTTQLDEVNNKLNDAMKPSKYFKYLTIAMVVITLVLTGLSIWSTLSDYDAYYNVTFTPIPKFMVDEVDIITYNRKGEKIVINNQTAYYRIVTCNRKEGSSDREKEVYGMLKDRSDLNGDIGKQWLALYSVKYRNSSPILADSLKFSADNLPDGYDTGIHAFGEKTPMNINKKTYLFAENPPARYVCFKKADETIEDLTADHVLLPPEKASYYPGVRFCLKNLRFCGSIIVGNI